MDIKQNWTDYIHDLQNKICAAIEEADGKAKFAEDKWERPEGGGGKTRVIANGNVFEKGGVNTSVVFGEVNDAMRTQLKINGTHWWACGLSLVLHPVNPFVPTVHCNYRMFEVYKAHPYPANGGTTNTQPLHTEETFNSAASAKSEVSERVTPLTGEPEGAVIDRWLGGGTDLTPYYLFEEDAKHFHQTYKIACGEFDPALYPKFKKWCDDYFVNTHRGNERRGIGGIFYDHQREDEKHDVEFWMNFGKACGDSFIAAYIPIVEKRKNTPYTEENKHWQEIRRGRYVEFNLVHDRGTLFGLKTNGRIESILMSLPPTVRFEYNYQPRPGSEEDKLLQVCLHPRDWA